MIIDILAGKMNFDGKKVSPDPRKGLLRLVIDGVTDRVTLQWLNRETNPPAVETEWTGPVSVEEVPSAKSGKVYVIKSSNAPTEKQFVWIQQPSSVATGNAAGYTAGGVDNVDAVMNQIQMLAQISSGKSALEIFTQAFGEDEIGDDQMLVDLHHHGELDDEDDDEEGDFEHMMEHLMEAAGDDSDQSAVLGLLLSDPNILNSCMAQLMVAVTNFAVANSLLPTHEQQTNPTQVTQISSIISSPEAQSTLTEESVKARLLAFCPEGETSVAQILQSPQFGETLRSLTEGVYSDNIALLFSSLGLDPAEIYPNADLLETLCRMLQNKHKK